MLFNVTMTICLQETKIWFLSIQNICSFFTKVTLNNIIWNTKDQNQTHKYLPNVLMRTHMFLPIVLWKHFMQITKPNTMYYLPIVPHCFAEHTPYLINLFDYLMWHLFDTFCKQMAHKIKNFVFMVFFNLQLCD